MSKHFLCCIPVRVAVFVSSLLSFLFAGAVAGGAWFLLIRIRQLDEAALLTTQQNIALYVIGGVFTVICLVSLFGFIGSVMRKRSYVALYSTLAYATFTLEVILTAYAIYSLFQDNGPLKCTVTENGTTGSCKDVLKNSRGAIIAFLVLKLLIQLYICIVIRRYVHQLDEEQSYHRTSGYVNSAFKMGPTSAAYYPHQPLEQGQGLLHPQGHYPYSDPHHSFGK